MLRYLLTFWEDLKAFRRGEVRIAPRSATRGRIYARRNQESPSSGSVFSLKKTPKATLTMKITRADGTVETVVVPASVTQVDTDGKHFHSGG